MKKNVYYIEDDEEDLINFSQRLASQKVSIFPTHDSWIKEINAFQLYLQNSNEENTKRIVDIFNSYNIDLFLIDISLFHSNSGGMSIYDQIIKQYYESKCVLFLTYPDTEESVKTSHKVKIEFKTEGKGGKLDYSLTSYRVYEKIKELLHIKDGLRDIVNDLF